MDSAHRVTGADAIDLKKRGFKVRLMTWRALSIGPCRVTRPAPPPTGMGVAPARVGVARDAERAPRGASRPPWSAAWLSCAAAAMATFNRRDVLGNRASRLRAAEFVGVPCRRGAAGTSTWSEFRISQSYYTT